MTHTKPDRQKRYTIEDFKPYVKRQVDWDNRILLVVPNWQPLTPQNLLNHIAYSKFPELHGYMQDPTDYQSWGTIWLNTLQSGNLDGSGYIAIPQLSDRDPWCASFALCRHKNQNMPSARPERGLHDQFCTECGLNTSYDSSD